MEARNDVKITKKGHPYTKDGTHLQSSVVYPGYDTDLSNIRKRYL